MRWLGWWDSIERISAIQVTKPDLGRRTSGVDCDLCMLIPMIRLVTVWVSCCLSWVEGLGKFWWCVGARVWKRITGVLMDVSGNQNPDKRGQVGAPMIYKLWNQTDKWNTRLDWEREYILDYSFLIVKACYVGKFESSYDIMLKGWEYHVIASIMKDIMLNHGKCIIAEKIMLNVACAWLSVCFFSKIWNLLDCSQFQEVDPFKGIRT